MSQQINPEKAERTENAKQRAEELGLVVRQAGEVFTSVLPMRWGDLDAQGHVNNGVFLDYLQDGRLDFVLAGDVPDMLKGVVAVQHVIDYVAPVHYSEEPLKVHIVMLDRGRARFVVGYVVTYAGRTVAMARSVMTPFDLDTQRPRRLTEAEIAWFDRHRWQIEDPFAVLPGPALHGRGHHTRVLTRWSDIDRFHHVNNVRLFDFFQESRVGILAAAHPRAAHVGSRDGDEAAPVWVVARQDVDYLAQVRWNRDPYVVTTAVTRLGTSSVMMASELTDPASDEVLCRSRNVMVHCDHEGPAPIPDEVRAGLERFVIEA